MTNLTKAKILWWAITFFYILPAIALGLVALISWKKSNNWVQRISYNLSQFRREKCFDIARGYTLTIED